MGHTLRIDAWWFPSVSKINQDNVDCKRSIGLRVNIAARIVL